MKSLDPRVNRLPVPGTPGTIVPKVPLDQFGSFEVFVQAKEGKPFQHEGIVHAPNLELAFVLAKEAFTRRFTCHSLYVTETRDVFVSPTTEAEQNAYDLIEEATSPAAKEPYEIYHLPRRGKQHIHAGTVTAGSPEEAMWLAKQSLNTKAVFNVWAVRSAAIRRTTPEEAILWQTLPDKKFRDASDYKGGDKLKEFLERRNA
ncbi:MAG: phenylacetic acid degradation b [Cyclobacteriaceae bacterium]|nr:phenylacetic acid degradation b [Cyclobacteriaceae bacterium]